MQCPMTPFSGLVIPLSHMHAHPLTNPCTHTCTHYTDVCPNPQLTAGGKTKTVGGWVESGTCCACSCFLFIHMLVMVDQACLNMKTLSLFKLFFSGVFQLQLS